MKSKSWKFRRADGIEYKVRYIIYFDESGYALGYLGEWTTSMFGRARALL